MSKFTIKKFLSVIAFLFLIFVSHAEARDGGEKMGMEFYPHAGLIGLTVQNGQVVSETFGVAGIISGQGQTLPFGILQITSSSLQRIFFLGEFGRIEVPTVRSENRGSEYQRVPFSGPRVGLGIGLSL